MSRFRTLLAPLAAAALLLLLVPAPPAAAHGGSTTCVVDTVSGIWSCPIVCHTGDALVVAARTTGPSPPTEWPRLRVTCGGADGYCQMNQQCADVVGIARYDGHGTCFAETVFVLGTCAAVPTGLGPKAAVGAGGATTPGVASRHVETPGLGRACLTLGLVCVGPVGPQHVGDTPAVDGTQAPHAGASVARGPVVLPRVTMQTVGPIQVTGEPVPITVCAAGCTAPGGVEGELRVSGEVAAEAAGQRVQLPIALP